MKKKYAKVRKMLLDNQIDEIVAQGAGAVPALIDALNGGDWMAAADYVTVFGKDPGDSVLSGVFEDARDFEVRALEALGRIGDKSAVPALIEALKDENCDRRLEVAKALGEIGDKSAVPALIETLKEEGDFKVRLEAAKALGEIGDKSAVPALIETLDSQSRDVRREIVRVVVKIGKPAVRLLIDALDDNDDNSYAWEGAAEALGEIGLPAVPALIRALKDGAGGAGPVEALVKIAEKSDINLRAVEKALEKHVDSMKKERTAVEMGKLKREAGDYYIKISKAAGRRAAEKHSLAGDGVILEGERPKPPSGKKMYREGARAFV